MAPVEVFSSRIAPRSKKCLELFHLLIQAFEDSDSNSRYGLSDSLASDALGRFQIWGGNIGAFQGAELGSSLDSRLQKSEKLSDQIVTLLDDLAESLDDARSILLHLKENRTGYLPGEAPKSENARVNIDIDDTEGVPNEEVSEIHEIFESILDAIKHLFQYSVIIRNNTNRDRYATSAAAAMKLPFNDQFDISHVQHRFPALESKENRWLSERLGKAITQRRHYLRYCRQHHDRLSQEPSTIKHSPKTPALKSDGDLIAQPIKHPPRSEPSLPVSTVALTKASTLLLSSNPTIEEEDAEDVQSQTSYATSVDEGEDNNSKLRVVALEQVKKGLSHFECPYCWQILTCKTQKSWRKHVLSDLRPYVCTFEACENTKLFSSRQEWFSHELTDHRREWQCHFCPRKPFSSAISYKTHVTSQHSNSVTEDQFLILLEMSQRTLLTLSPSDCVFCDDWEVKLREVNQHISKTEDLVVTPKQFQSHLGGHMEQLALFAIPPSMENEEAGSSNAAAQLNSDVSSLSSTPVSDAGAALRHCEDILIELSNAGEIAKPFITPSTVPSIALTSTGPPRGNYEIPPLDLEKISQKLQSGDYKTPYQFQRDVYLMFLVHRATQLPEGQITPLEELFEKRSQDQIGVQHDLRPFLVDMEKEIRWKIYTSHRISAKLHMKETTISALEVSIIWKYGTVPKNVVRSLDSTDMVMDIYNFVECMDILGALSEFPENINDQEPPDYVQIYNFKLTCYDSKIGLNIRMRPYLPIKEYIVDGSTIYVEPLGDTEQPSTNFQTESSKEEATTYRVFCKDCKNYPEGFKSDHELQMHQIVAHRDRAKKWICVEPKDDGLQHPSLILPLSKCKACSQRKQYGAYYNAAAHLRRTHFKPKIPKNKNREDIRPEMRGGKPGGDWPPMSELKSYWMIEVEPVAPQSILTQYQQDEIDVSDNEEETHDMVDSRPDGSVRVENKDKRKIADSIPENNQISGLISEKAPAKRSEGIEAHSSQRSLNIPSGTPETWNSLLIDQLGRVDLLAQVVLNEHKPANIAGLEKIGIVIEELRSTIEDISSVFKVSREPLEIKKFIDEEKANDACIYCIGALKKLDWSIAEFVSVSKSNELSIVPDIERCYREIEDSLAELHRMTQKLSDAKIFRFEADSDGELAKTPLTLASETNTGIDSTYSPLLPRLNHLREEINNTLTLTKTLFQSLNEVSSNFRESTGLEDFQSSVNGLHYDLKSARDQFSKHIIEEPALSAGEQIVSHCVRILTRASNSLSNVNRNLDSLRSPKRELHTLNTSITETRKSLCELTDLLEIHSGAGPFKLFESLTSRLSPIPPVAPPDFDDVLQEGIPSSDLYKMLKSVHDLAATIARLDPSEADEIGKTPRLCRITMEAAIIIKMFTEPWKNESELQDILRKCLESGRSFLTILESLVGSQSSKEPHSDLVRNHLELARFRYEIEMSQLEKYVRDINSPRREEPSDVESVISIDSGRQRRHDPRRSEYVDLSMSAYNASDNSDSAAEPEVEDRDTPSSSKSMRKRLSKLFSPWNRGTRTSGGISSKGL